MAKTASEKKPSKPRYRKKRRPVLRFFKVLLLLLMISILAVGGLAFSRIYPEFEKIRENAVETYSHMEENDFRMITDTVIYDKDGSKLGVINTGHYKYVPFEDISPWLKKAYIAQEDRRFYSHNGVDIVAMIRAALSYAKNRRVTQGGSTITQQVIKNTYLTQERTWERKITEILIAPQLEAQFGKDKILEFYCNGNFYAHGCYGVGAASRYYFNKSAADLEPWEAAVLVGISNRPASYEPVGHPENAKRKRNEILNSMYECGDITSKELKEYCAKPLQINTEHEESDGAQNYQCSYAIHCAVLQLMKNEDFDFQYTFDTKAEYDAYKAKYNEVYSEKSELVRGGGYRIYTTLDPDIQAMLQRHIDEELDTRSDEQQENGKYAMQGAAVTVDNGTGAVVAIVGGRGTTDEYNRGYLMTRQPGSSIKPLLDYGPAFETGYFYPSYVINDHEFEDGPANSGGGYHGYLTIREALNRSLNTVAWQLLEKVGIKNGLAYLGKMEFSSLSWQDTTAMAVSIGGFTYGARVCDMAKGYSTLANGGVYDDKTCLRSLILDSTGEELYDSTPNRTQVYTEGTAFILTDVLKGTMDAPYGTGRRLDIPGQQAAGKTGTANDSKDTWFCGYTRYYSTAVWVGYDTPRPMPGIYGATIAGTIWRDFMTELHDGYPELDWEQPATVIKAWYNYDHGQQVEYNSGQRDYFNTAVDPDAKAVYEAVQGTTVYDPHSWMWDETTAPPAAPPPAVETQTEAPETVVVPVTGFQGGPGVTQTETVPAPAPAETLPPQTETAPAVIEPVEPVPVEAISPVPEAGGVVMPAP